MRKALFGLFISLLVTAFILPMDTRSIEASETYTATTMGEPGFGFEDIEINAVATGAEADSTAWGSQRKLVITSDGNLHVVYHRKDSSGILQIYHAESADGGRTWAEELGEFTATAYYCVYESEMDGTQSVARVISDTSYTLKASFLFGGHGVGMQGTGRIGPDGDYIHYEGGDGSFVSVDNPLGDAEVS